MHFSTAFLAGVVLMLPAYAVPSPLINITKSTGGTNGGYIVVFKSDSAKLSFVKGKSTVTHSYDIINGCAGMS